MMNKVAVVTGGGAGIGLTFARALASDGATVVVLDVDAGVAERAVAAMREEGLDAVASCVDITHDEAVAREAAAIGERFGGVDVLVNNAGRHLHRYAQPCTRIDLALWDDLFAVNLRGTLVVTRAFVPLLSQRDGSSIVNVSSAGGVTTPTSAYGVSKSAVLALTVALAAELASVGIRVNAIAPGMVDSPAAEAELEPAFKERIVAQQRIQRLGRMDDLVGALRYLVSDGASFVTGQTLVVDGGMRMRV